LKTSFPLTLIVDFQSIVLILCLNRGNDTRENEQFLRGVLLGYVTPRGNQQ